MKNQGPHRHVIFTPADPEYHLSQSVGGPSCRYIPAMTAAQDDAGEVLSPTQHLGDAMSRVARQLQEDHADVEGTLQAITAAAVRTVPHADECGISYVIARRKIEPRAWTSDLPRRVDSLQERLKQGPCMDAAWDQQIVRVDDVRADERWPEFGTQAAELGVGSMMCFQLFVTGDQLGALNMYSRTRSAFDDESQDIGLLFASHAAVALAGQSTRRTCVSAWATGTSSGRPRESSWKDTA